MHREMNPQYFHYYPNRIFQCSRTPAGLYARQKWMQQKDTDAWQSDFEETVDDLFSGQQHNGSWGDSLLGTIHRLFGLHLTVRNRDERIEKAMEWLFEQHGDRRGYDELKQNSDIVCANELRNLPFSRGCYDHVLTCSILFLGSLFGYQSDERIIGAYDMLEGCARRIRKKWCNWSCSNNFFRACIVHPQYRDCGAVRLFVSELRKLHKVDGTWPPPIPFYQTVNALGHLDTEDAEHMLRKAFLKLRESQNRDGTWGRFQKEWHTFLIVHAVRRKSSLLEKMEGAP